MTCYIGHGCSIASFEKGELGEAIPEAELPQHIRERVASPYMPAGPAAATPHLQAPLSASARMPPPPTHQASLPWCAHAYTALLVAESRFTHVFSMCAFNKVKACTSRMLATRSPECSNAPLLKQQQSAIVLQQALWQPWSIGLKALMFQAGQLLPEEDNLMSPLPMRQLNHSSLAAKSGIKRIAPAAIDPGKATCHILQ